MLRHGGSQTQSIFHIVRLEKIILSQLPIKKGRPKPSFHTGEAGVEPALTVLETAFLPLEDSPIYMSIRNLLPDSSVVLYAPSKPHILVADWMVVFRPPSCHRFESGSFDVHFVHVFMSLLPKHSFRRKPVIHRSLRSRFHDICFTDARPVLSSIP